MAIAAFIVGSVCLALLGSYRYVETLTRWSSESNSPLLRLALAAMFAIAIVSKGALVVTALVRGVAVRVLSRRSTGKLSWRRTVSESKVT